MLRIVAAAFGALSVSGCIAVEFGPSAAPAQAQAAQPAYAVGATSSASVRNAAGAVIGTARFQEGPRGVLMQLELAAGSVSPGWHGAHIHLVGDCSDPAAGFQASGGHVGHGEGRMHGFLSAYGPEAGDLPNIFAPAAGPIQWEAYSSLLTLGPNPVDGRAALLDADGAALVIHANRDDHLTQPIGGAGARIACAVIARG